MEADSQGDNSPISDLFRQAWVEQPDELVGDGACGLPGYLLPSTLRDGLVPSRSHVDTIAYKIETTSALRWMSNVIA